MFYNLHIYSDLSACPFRHTRGRKAERMLYTEVSLPPHTSVYDGTSYFSPAQTASSIPEAATTARYVVKIVDMSVAVDSSGIAMTV